MKIFFDTEFTGLHKNTTLISIGMIAENGQKFYAEFNDYDKSQVDEWIESNVINNLCYTEEEKLPFLGIHACTSYACKSNKKTIKELLAAWLEQFDYVEFVSDCSHYDMVLLIDLFGTAFNFPDHIAATCYDINQDIAKFHNISLKEAFNVSREDILNTHNIKIKGKLHNALYDAKMIKELYNIFSK